MKLSTWMNGLIAAVCLSALSASAVGPEVRDDAGLFSASAVKQADEVVRRIQRDFRKDLLVETYPKVPEGKADEYARNREEFFSNFVRDRAQSARLDGIYVLIMKEQPPHRYRIQVGVGQGTRQRAFLLSDRDELVRVFQSSFRADKYDDALKNGVAFVERTLRNNLSGTLSQQPAAQTPLLRQSSRPMESASGSSWVSVLLIGVFVIGAIMMVGFLIRLLRGGMGGSPSMVGGGGYGGGGGGFFSGLLGGIGGAMAGSWLYDRFFSNNAHADDLHSSNRQDSLPSDYGSDFSSSGGDVDSGGGGDFGGGGDMGGGGGDFGGGGGDA